MPLFLDNRTDPDAQLADFMVPAFVARSRSMQVPEEFKKSVVFVGIKENGRFKPRATAFVVSYEKRGFWFTYLVTAEHVIAGVRKLSTPMWMRNNLVNGGTTETEIDLANWFSHPNNAAEATDVAVTPLQIEAADDLRALPIVGANSWAATPEVIATQRIGPGEETAIVGLFRSHFGEGKNIPVVRIGNISALADEPVYTRYCGFTKAHLIEARSIAGLSGSPVFIHVPPIRVFDGRVEYATGNQFYLLGLVHGHFDVQDISEDIVVEDARTPVGINTGMGLVIPIEKIVETINRPELEEQRQRSLEIFDAKRGATADDVSDPAGEAKA